MSLQAIEGTIERGQIRLKQEVLLPDHTKVYVIIPDNQEQRAFHVSPRLANPAQASDFEMEMTEDGIDAHLGRS
jgi:hypothetical protein